MKVYQTDGATDELHRKMKPGSIFKNTELEFMQCHTLINGKQRVMQGAWETSIMLNTNFGVNTEEGCLVDVVLLLLQWADIHENAAAERHHCQCTHQARLEEMCMSCALTFWTKQVCAETLVNKNAPCVF